MLERLGFDVFSDMVIAAVLLMPEGDRVAFAEHLAALAGVELATDLYFDYRRTDDAYETGLRAH